MASTCLGLVVALLAQVGPIPESRLYQPGFCLDDCLRGPATEYVPQPGDIFLATDQSFWMRIGHQLANGRGVHHSGIVFAKPDGSLALLEAGPFNELVIRAMVPYVHMSNHVNAGDKVWIRRRIVPLTPCESARLTALASIQDGKPFALARMVGFITPFTRRGPIRTAFVGKVHGDRKKFFCAELVTECLVAAGLIEGATARPSAMVPRDLFFGGSGNGYIDRHLTINAGWYPPARWLPGGPG